MSTTVCVNGTVQFTFFLVMRFNVTFVTSYFFAYYNTCNLTFSLLKLEHRLKKHIRNVTRIKYGFVEQIAILFAFIIRCDYVIADCIFFCSENFSPGQK